MEGFRSQKQVFGCGRKEEREEGEAAGAGEEGGASESVARRIKQQRRGPRSEVVNVSSNFPKVS